MAETGLLRDAAEQAVEYLAEGARALGTLPTQETLVLERFFDESGGMQLVLRQQQNQEAGTARLAPLPTWARASAADRRTSGCQSVRATVNPVSAAPAAAPITAQRLGRGLAHRKLLAPQLPCPAPAPHSPRRAPILPRVWATHDLKRLIRVIGQGVQQIGTAGAPMRTNRSAERCRTGATSFSNSATSAGPTSNNRLSASQRETICISALVAAGRRAASIPTAALHQRGNRHGSLIAHAPQLHGRAAAGGASRCASWPMRRLTAFGTATSPGRVAPGARLAVFRHNWPRTRSASWSAVGGRGSGQFRSVPLPPEQQPGKHEPSPPRRRKNLRRLEHRPYALSIGDFSRPCGRCRLFPISTCRPLACNRGKNYNAFRRPVGGAAARAQSVGCCGPHVATRAATKQLHRKIRGSPFAVRVERPDRGGILTSPRRSHFKAYRGGVRMTARPSVILVLLAAVSSMGATYRTQNFVVEAPTQAIAEQVGQYAEYYTRARKPCSGSARKCRRGRSLAPCASRSPRTRNGGGATSFAFDHGHILGQNMQIEGLPQSCPGQRVAARSYPYGSGAVLPPAGAALWPTRAVSVFSEDELERQRHDAWCATSSTRPAAPFRCAACSPCANTPRTSWCCTPRASR